MNRDGLEFLALAPGQKEGKNTLNIYLCNTSQDCHTIDFDARLGSSTQRQWLLNQLVFDQPPAENTISALNSRLVSQVVGALYCLRSVEELPKTGEAFLCNPKHGRLLTARRPGHWSYRPGNDSTYSFQSWLFRGKGQRLLPLNRCDQSARKDHYRCGSFISWGCHLILADN